MKVKNLNLRTVIPPLVIILLGGLILGRWIIKHTIDTQTNLFSERILAETHLLSQLAAIDWEDNDPDVVTRYWAERSDSTVLILGPDAVIIGSSGETNLASPVLRPEITDAMEAGYGVFVDTTQQTGAPIIFAAREIIIDDIQVGYVHITEELTELANLERQLLRTLTLTVTAIIVVMTTILIIVTNANRRRLTDIFNATQKILDGNYSHQINPGPRDEIGLVASSINQLNVKVAAQIKELKVKQAQISAALQQMNEGVMILDEQGQIVLANPYAIKFFDISEDETTGKSLIRVIQNHQITELWQDYSATRKEQAAIVEIADMNKLIQVSLTPLDESLQDHSLIVFQDLTQIHQLQTIRRDFISNISHELRTPIASLKALAETLQISAIDDPEASRRFLDRMEIEIEALAQMVSELLELTRIESGQVPLELEKIDANVVLNNAVERISVQAERANVSLKAKLSAEPVFILADPPRMEQVLVNILHNAIKFTPIDGKVRCKIIATEEDVLIKIQDNGKGIPHEDLPRIFERFYKSKRPKQGSGTGLGLSIAKHLVEAHGGKIWVESQLGQGSIFFISLKRQ